jgi:hypothetical protein
MGQRPSQFFRSLNGQVTGDLEPYEGVRVSDVPHADDLCLLGRRLNETVRVVPPPVGASVAVTVPTAVAVAVAGALAVAVIAAVPLIPGLAGIGALFFLSLPALPTPLVPFAVAVLFAVAPA